MRRISLVCLLICISCSALYAEYRFLLNNDQNKYYSDEYQGDKDYVVNQTHSPEDAIAIYYSSKYLKETEDIAATNESRVPDYKGIPQGGCIYIKIYSYDIKDANTKNSLFIVLDANNKEIYKSCGNKLITPDINYGSGPTFCDYHVINLWKQPAFPLKVQIIKTVSDEKINFAISKVK